MSIQKFLSSEDSETSSPNSLSDIYFDDEFSTASMQKQDRHLRLDATLGLDNPPNAALSNSLFFSPYTATKQRSRVCKDSAWDSLQSQRNTRATTDVNVLVPDGDEQLDVHTQGHDKKTPLGCVYLS